MKHKKRFDLYSIGKKRMADRIADLEISLVMAKAMLYIAQAQLEVIAATPKPKFQSGGFSGLVPEIGGELIQNGSNIISAKETGEILKIVNAGFNHGSKHIIDELKKDSIYSHYKKIPFVNIVGR